MKTPATTRGVAALACGLLLGLAALSPAPAAAGPPDDGKAAVSAEKSVAEAPIVLFQRFVSRADGHRCPMTPTCSAYARQAIREHGALMGWVMACDRLMRCGRDELRRSPTVFTPHGIRTRDPVANNDFWWQ